MAKSKQKKAKKEEAGHIFSANELEEYKRTIAELDGLRPKDADDNKFFYAIGRNADRIESCLKTFNKRMKDPDEQYIEYERDRYQLGLKCGAKQLPNGNLDTGSIKQTDKFNNGLLELQEKYSEAIANQEQINKENDKLRRDDIIDDLEIYKIKYHLIPAEVTFGQRRKLSVFFTEPEEEDFEKMKVMEPDVVEG